MKTRCSKSLWAAPIAVCAFGFPHVVVSFAFPFGRFGLPPKCLNPVACAVTQVRELQPGRERHAGRVLQERDL